LAQNEREVVESRSWRQFKRHAEEGLIEYITASIKQEREETFI
jgi:hypothetical protein